MTVVYPTIAGSAEAAGLAAGLASGQSLLPRDLFLQMLQSGDTAFSNIWGAGAAPRYTTMPMIGGGTSTGAAPALVPSDNDLYDIQWHFGYMGDIQTIWDEYSGSGVHVGVYDDGLQYTHPDLAANYTHTGEVTVDGQIVDPLQSTITYWSAHGTAVAGLIAAANNDIGTVGVAWGASLTGVNIFSFNADINNNYAGFLEAASQTGNFDVTNHSWGKFPGFWQDGVSNVQDQGLIERWFDALENGRSGLGTINVKAAGNADQNSNGDSTGTSRASIVVGAYDDDGDASYYSSYGANLLVSAPSSGLVDFFLGAINKGQVTTDLIGFTGPGNEGLPLGYNGLDDLAYTNSFGGTSGATPIVSGVVSLMLDANEYLGWRDVQNILAYSAHEIGSGVGGTRLNDENNTWKYNGADNWNGGGLHYSEDYGYGGVDAYNAVRMAEVWTLFNGPNASTNESSFQQTTTAAVTLADGMVTDIHFTFGGPDFNVEFVDIAMDISHTKLDDLEISLISPDGTVSSLIDFRFELFYTPDLEQATLTFGANGFRGENGAGEWTIRIVDRWAQDEGTVNTASITLHGTDTADGSHSADDDVYHYTDEIFTSIARDPSRITLADTDGGTDWLDLSAMTGDILLRMQQGNSSNVAGITFLRTALGTEIENAVTGDGDDDISGSRGDNRIYGMRGDDFLWGADGNDTLSGGAGIDTLRGGAGDDTFLFDRPLNEATNVDTVEDFNYVYFVETPADKIWLESSVFTALSLGALSFDAFALGTSAADADDRIIYDALTGALYYDADGLGGSAQIKFAQFDQLATANNGPHAILAYDDFVVVDTTNSVIVGSGTDRDQSDAATTSTSTHTPNLFGNGTPITGTQYGDEIIAKDSDDAIDGLGGDDFLVAGGGNDVVNGGAGYDTIYGEDGDDILRGDDTPTSTTSVNGDEIFGGDGNDVIHGSAQQNYLYNFTTNFGAPGDVLVGDDGDDILFGYDGNDQLVGGKGNNQLYGGNGGDVFWGGSGTTLMDGGAGSDIFNGGLGDDTILVGKGIENWVYGGDQIDLSAPELNIIGYDTVIFEGNYADYKITGGVLLFFGGYGGLEFHNTTVGSALVDQDISFVEWQTIEKMVFADRVIDLVERPLGVFAGDLTSSNAYVNAGTPVSITTNGWEHTAVVQGAGDVTISDVASADELDFVYLFHVNGTTNITSDVLETLDIRVITGSVTVHAAAGERDLELRTYGLKLDADEKLSDDTATGVSLSFIGDGIVGLESQAQPAIASAGVNGANLSFQSAETIRVVDNDFGDITVRWDIRSATTIDMREPFRMVEEVAGTFKNTFGFGNVGTFNILTPIDDSVLSAGGGSAGFTLIGHEIQGNELVRLGNRGLVNASNDGTVGDEALINAGLGFRGTMLLGGGQDEVRILGSDAFQGGTIDAGNVAPEYLFPEADVIRMTFGVAEAIADISANISNFEILHLTATDQSHTADVTKFDSLAKIVISSTSDAAGTNTVTNIVDGSEVTFKTSGDRDVLSNTLGTIALEMAGSGPADALSIAFEGREADGADIGHIVVLGAETVRISGDNLDYQQDRKDYFGQPLPPGPETDPFTGITLDLQDTTNVYLSGETGWDFTTPGTNISNVTLIDGSAITNTGTLSGITATAPTANAVTFIGGAGNDVFEGGAGDDTLQGGKGNDTYILNASSSGDSLIELADGGSDTIQSGLGDIDLNNFVNIENGELTGNAGLSITGTATANSFKGNAGDNAFDGGLGADTAIFTGNLEDYTIVRNGDGSVTVADNRTANSDGTDTLVNVEYMQFANGRHSVNPAAPTDILLSNNTIAESSFEGILVGTLAATDSEGDTATYELVDDASGRFKLVGNKVVTVYHSLIDFEQQASHTITVKVTDGDGLSFEKTLSIDVLDTNPEYVVGRNDIDTDDIIYGGTFNDFLAGNGGNDTLRGGGGFDTLRGGVDDDTAEFSGNFADYEITLGNRVLYVEDKRPDTTGTGAGPDGIDTLYHFGLIFEEIGYADAIEHLKFADQIVNTADLIAPTDMELSATVVDEAVVAGSEVGQLTTIDKSDVIPGVVTETFTYSLIDNAGGLFAILGDKLVVAEGAALDFETAASHDVKVRVTDGDGHTFDKTFTIGVTDANDAATVSLANTRESIIETASTAVRRKVADIVVTDADQDAAFRNNTLSLTGRDAALFEIVGSSLFLKAGVNLDFTKKTSLDVAIAVDDAGVNGNPDAVSATYKLAITDAADLRVIHGSGAGNVLSGTAGGDYFVGHGGRDTFIGGTGDDRYVVDSADDRVVEKAGGGWDVVRSSITYALPANVESLVLTGTGDIDGTGNDAANWLTGNGASNRLSGLGGNDRLNGRSGDDTLSGGSGNDRLYGDDGADRLLGGSGNDQLFGESGADRLDAGVGADTLSGGAGRDVLIGGADGDTFVFGADDVATGVVRDLVWDFRASLDKIDLSAIDARAASSRNDAFSFIGNDAFHGKAGELNFEQFNFAGTAKDVTIISGDTNGDRVADFEIELRGLHTLTSSDFVL